MDQFIERDPVSDSTSDNKNHSNLSKGKDSFDINVGGSVVEFFNRNSSEYPVEIGAPRFEPIPITKQKDNMVNVARLYAQQEYDRIMEMVQVLQKQANDIKRRLEITDAVHAAKYKFQLYQGNTYWLLYDTLKQCTRLSLNGPNEWFTGKPDEYEYIAQVKWLGDYTWIEVSSNNGI